MGLVFGQNARRIVSKGSLMASYQYVDEKEAIVLARARHSGANRPVVVIKLDELFKYADDGFLAKAAIEIANILDFGVSRYAANEVALFINDLLEDLLTMKPMPMEMRKGVDIERVIQNDRGGLTAIGTARV